MLDIVFWLDLHITGHWKTSHYKGRTWLNAFCNNIFLKMQVYAIFINIINNSECGFTNKIGTVRKSWKWLHNILLNSFFIYYFLLPIPYFNQCTGLLWTTLCIVQPWVSGLCYMIMAKISLFLLDLCCILPSHWQ